MDARLPAFEFEYLPGNIAFGNGCVETIGTRLQDRGLSNALVVCGSNVGGNRDVMAPIESGLGDALGAVFAETTPKKYLGTALDGAELVRESGIDAVVSVGGGSSLDVAKAISALGRIDRPRDEIWSEIEETGLVPVQETEPSVLPLFVVPTTLAGADLTTSGGINLSRDPYDTDRATDERVSAKVGDDRLMPESLFYDPELFATTPTTVLAASSMNGFDKGIETLYSRSTNPISDAHALHGLELFREGLPGLTDAGPDDEALRKSVVGTILVQYGRRPNIIHAFGNGISSYYPVHQGMIHAIMAPPVLRYVFDSVDARRSLVARGLGIDLAGMDDPEIADEIVATVSSIRDELGLQSSLRTVEGLRRDDLAAVATVVANNFHFERSPAGIDPDPDDIEELLRAAW